MHCFWLGCSVVLLIFLSAEGNAQTQTNSNVFQKPRFISFLTGRTVVMYCVAQNPALPAEVQWFKGKNSKDPLNNSTRIKIKEKNKNFNASITIMKLEVEDSGTYFCILNGTRGPGTELQVSRFIDPQAVLQRSRVKDVFIFLQTFLLILCIIFPLVKMYKLDKKEEADYEEPENDHIYEGLEIEQTGCDLYEDITAYAQNTEAAWEVESPDQE